MLKEIHEQPTAIDDTIAERFHHGELHLDGLGLTDDDLRAINRVLIVGCGTALHSGLVGRYLIEEWGGVATEADVASEWRYRNGVFDPRTLVLAISQSGETADTLEALRMAKTAGYLASLTVCNSPHSSMTRESDLVMMTQAGPEIGVASTKAFTTQLLSLLLVTLMLGRARGMSAEREAEFVPHLYHAAAAVEQALEMNDYIKLLAEDFAEHARIVVALTEEIPPAPGAREDERREWPHAFIANVAKQVPHGLRVSARFLVLRTPLEDVLPTVGQAHQQPANRQTFKQKLVQFAHAIFFKPCRKRIALSM